MSVFSEKIKIKNYTVQCKIFNFALWLLLSYFYFFPLSALANGDDTHEMADTAPKNVPSIGMPTVVEETSVREGPVVNMNVSPLPAFVNQPVQLDFFVNEKPGNVPVPFYELDVEHTKLVHVIGVRNDLNEFRHIHPEPSSENPAVFTIMHTFDQHDSYTFWSEISRAGRSFIFKHPEIEVLPLTEKDPRQKPLDKAISLARNVIVGDYQVALRSPESIGKGHAIDLTLDVHTLVGDGVALEEYLGEQMHLVAIKEDLSQFIHAHPATAHAHALNSLAPIAYAHGPTGDAPGYEPVNFTIVFPTTGFYKLFAQFRPLGANLAEDEARTAAFWVKVEEGGLTPAAARLLLATVSLSLTALLSVGVYRYMYRAA